MSLSELRLQQKDLDDRLTGDEIQHNLRERKWFGFVSEIADFMRKLRGGDKPSDWTPIIPKTCSSKTEGVKSVK